MPSHTWIDSALLQRVSELAVASPRGRMNFNFHRCEDDASHRLLNAVEPGSYIRPHRHLDPAKDETLIVVRGRLGAVVFDEAGNVVDTAVLVALGDLAAASMSRMAPITPCSRSSRRRCSTNRRPVPIARCKSRSSHPGRRRKGGGTLRLTLRGCRRCSTEISRPAIAATLLRPCDACAISRS